ncbi:unnamed protein product, partial [Owenia fusiformis]
MTRLVVGLFLCLQFHTTVSYPGDQPSNIECTFEPSDTNCRLQNKKLWKRGQPRDLPSYGPRLPTVDHTYGTEAGTIYYTHGAYGDSHSIAYVDFEKIWDLTTESKCIEFWYFCNWNYTSNYVYVGTQLGTQTKEIKQITGKTTEWTHFYTPLPRGNYTVVIGAHVANYLCIDDIRVYDCPNEHTDTPIPTEVKRCDFDTDNCDFSENIYDILQWTRSEISTGLHVKTEAWEPRVEGDQAQIYETSPMTVPNSTMPYCLEYNYGKIGMTNPFGYLQINNRFPDSSIQTLRSIDLSQEQIAENNWEVIVLPPGVNYLAFTYVMKGASSGGPKINGFNVYQCPFLGTYDSSPPPVFQTKLNCDFETDACSMTSANGNVEQYVVSGGSTDHGPPVDHTTGTVDGKFLKLNSSMHSISTPSIMSNPQMCVELYVYLTDTSQIMNVSHSTEEIWNSRTDESLKLDAWNQIFVNMPATGHNVVHIDVRSSNSSYRGNLGFIDDLKIDYCGVLDSALIPTRPTVPPPMTASTAQGGRTSTGTRQASESTTTKWYTPWPTTQPALRRCYKCSHSPIDLNHNEACISDPKGLGT